MNVLLKDDISFDVIVIPAFRPDNGLGINKPGFTQWVEKLALVSDKNIKSYDDFLE